MRVEEEAQFSGGGEREWRPLLNGEYPPPGPTRYGPLNAAGLRTIEVFAVRSADGEASEAR